MKRLQGLGVLAFALFAAACSSVRLAYDNAGTLLRWQAQAYLDIHGEQVVELDARIATFLKWHRAVALREYVTLAQAASARVERGLSRADLVWGYDSLVAQMRTGLRAGAAEGGAMLDRLTPGQFEHLENRIAEDNRKFEREHLSGTPDERRAKRAQRAAERLEEWVGSLNAAQLERVERYSARAPLVDELRQREHKRRQAELFAMLRARAAGARLADWAARWEEGREPAYETALVQQREEVFDLLLDLDRMLTPAQRRRAAQRLKDYAADFAHLAGPVEGEGGRR